LGAMRVHLGEGEADTVVEHLDPHHVASRASADVASQLQALLDHDCPDERRRMKEIMATNPLFVPKWNIDVASERELALAKLKCLCDSKNFGIRDFLTKYAFYSISVAGCALPHARSRSRPRSRPRPLLTHAGSPPPPSPARCASLPHTSAPPSPTCRWPRR